MADLHAQPIQPLLFDPDHIAPTTSRLEFSYHADFLAETQRPQLNNYIRHAQIGQGEHGSVYLCNRIDPTLPIGHPNRRMPVAMKSVKRVSAKADKMQKLQRRELPKSEHTTVTDKIRTKERQIKREIAIMKKLRHPHVVRLYEIIDDRLREKIYIVMEHLGGGEIKWHNGFNSPVLTVAQSRRILRDALLGLEYLHRQGIIHRDIKPANLFWTDDRRQVKIGDFGVSHFCYAQQLGDAAVGDVKEPPRDPLFQNDVDLTRHAGTPSFLAPELVYEYTYDPRTKRFIYVDEPVKGPKAEKDGGENKDDDRDKDDPGPSRPPKPKVTPAIDVWALGVTLYCLLFGNTPFLGYVEGQQRGNEYRLYNMICNADWPAPPTMGRDLIPSGGRHPTGDSEGADVITLLDLFLQKDVSERITLEQVMDYPWVVRDLADINRWRQRNHQVVQEAPIRVSTVETSDAVSTVHFRWRWGSRLARHVSSLFRGVRPSNITRSTRPEAYDGVGVVSDPGLALRVRSRASSSGRNAEGRRGREAKPDKGKARADQPQSQPKTLKRRLSKSSKSLRAVSTERWQNTRPNSTSTSALPNSAAAAVPIAVPVTATSSRTTKSQSRRGSDSRTTASNTEGPSSGPSSPTSLGAGEKERRTGFMSLLHVLNWRPNKYPGRPVPRLAPATPVGAGATYTTHTQLQLQPGDGGRVTVLDGRTVGGAHPRGLPTGPNMRRSDEGLRRYTYVDADEGVEPGSVGYGAPLTGFLTAARRASSWGQGDKEEYTEMVSVRSVEQGLNEQLIGTGGVFRGGPAASGYDADAPGGVLMDVMMPDSDEEIDSDEERRRRALEPRLPRAPLIYGPLEQAEDNMRFGQPAYNKTPSLDGDDEDERLSDRETERRRVGAVTEQLQQLAVRVHVPIHVQGNGVGGPYGQELKPGNSRGEYDDDVEHHNGETENASDGDHDDESYEDEDDDDDEDDEALMVRRPTRRLD